MGATSRLLAVLTILAATENVDAQAASTDTIVDQRVAAIAGGTLTLELETGGDVIIRGWDQPAVRVRARLAGRDWRDTKLDLSPDASGLRLHSTLGGAWKSTSHAFEISVPREYNVTIASAGGGIEISQVRGIFRGDTRGGSIVLEHVRGRASLSTRGGNVRISDSDLEGLVTTRGGAVELSRVTGGVKTEPASDTQSSQTTEDGVRRITSRGGPITVADAPRGAVLHTNGGPVRVGRAGGPVDATSGAGEIDIGPTAGPVRAITGRGDITASVTRNLASSETVELTTGLGSVTLELPADFDGVFDLRTGYTRAHGRATRIQSDWNLQRSERGPIANGGTPQTYVSATGSVGSGGGRVVVRATNGDIIVKRQIPRR